MALLIAAFACAHVAHASTPDAAASAAPAPAAMAKPPARDWSEPPDFEALRAEFAARPDFAERCEAGRPLSAAFEALQAERFGELLALTAPWTERCPVDMEAHSLRAVALSRAGRASESEAHDMWARGLFEAVLASGDGKTPATAYHVISEFEEYAMLRLFRYPAERQQPAADGADALTVLADGESQVIYFAPTTRVAQVALGLGGAHTER